MNFLCIDIQKLRKKLTVFSEILDLIFAKDIDYDYEFYLSIHMIVDSLDEETGIRYHSKRLDFNDLTYFYYNLRNDIDLFVEDDRGFLIEFTDKVPIETRLFLKISFCDFIDSRMQQYYNNIKYT